MRTEIRLLLERLHNHPEARDFDQVIILILEFILDDNL